MSGVKVAKLQQELQQEHAEDVTRLQQEHAEQVAQLQKELTNYKLSSECPAGAPSRLLKVPGLSL